MVMALIKVGGKMEKKTKLQEANGIHCDLDCTLDDCFKALTGHTKQGQGRYHKSRLRAIRQILREASVDQLLTVGKGLIG